MFLLQVSHDNGGFLYGFYFVYSYGMCFYVNSVLLESAQFCVMIEVRCGLNLNLNSLFFVREYRFMPASRCEFVTLV